MIGKGKGLENLSGLIKERSKLKEEGKVIGEKIIYFG
jgi:hypothetical protein